MAPGRLALLKIGSFIFTFTGLSFGLLIWSVFLIRRGLGIGLFVQFIAVLFLVFPNYWLMNKKKIEVKSIEKTIET